MADPDIDFGVTLDLDEFIKRKEELVQLCKEIQGIDIDISGTDELEKRIARVNELVKDIEFAKTSGAKDFQDSLKAVNTRKTPHVGIGDAAYLSSSARGLDFSDIKNRTKKKKSTSTDDIDADALRAAKKAARDKLKFESATFKAIEKAYKLMSLKCRQSMYALEKASKKSWETIKSAAKKALDATHLTPAINAVKRAASTIATPFIKAYSAIRKEIGAVGRDLARLNTRLGNPVGKIGKFLGTAGSAIGRAGMGIGRVAGGALLSGAGMAATAVGGALLAAPAATIAAGVMNVRDATSYRDKKQELIAQRDRLSEVAKITGPTDDVINQYVELTKQIQLLDFEYRNVSDAAKQADQVWLTISQTMTSFTNTVGELATEGFVAVAGGVDNIGSAIESVLIPAIAGVVTVFTNWKDVTEVVAASVEVSLRTVWEYISWIFTSAIPDVIVGFVKNSPAIFAEWGKNLFTIIGNLGKLIISAFDGIGSMLFNLLPTSFQDGFSAVWSIICNFGNNITEFAVSLFTYIGSIPEKISVFWKNLLQGITNGWNSIIDGLGSLWEGIKAFASDKLDAVKNFFNKIFQIFKNAGSNLKAIWDAVTGVFKGQGWNLNLTSLTAGMDDIDKKYQKERDAKQAAREKKQADEAAKKEEERKRQAEEYAKEGRDENGYYRSKTLSWEELQNNAQYVDLLDGTRSKEEIEEARKKREKERAELFPANFNLLEGTDWTQTMKPFQEATPYQKSDMLQNEEQILQEATNRLAEGYNKNVTHVTEVYQDKKKEQREIAEHKQAPVGSAEAFQLAKAIQGSSTKSLEDAYNTMNNAATKYSPIINALKAQERAQEKQHEEQEKRNEVAEQQREDTKAATESSEKLLTSICETVTNIGKNLGGSVKFAEG